MYITYIDYMYELIIYIYRICIYIPYIYIYTVHIYTYIYIYIYILTWIDYIYCIYWLYIRIDHISIYRKISLYLYTVKYALGVYTDKGESWWTYGAIYGGLIFGRENTSICNLLNLSLFFFLQYKARILEYFASCKIWNMFKVNNKGTKIRKVNEIVNNKDTADVVLVSLFLTLNTFHFLL